VAPPSFVTGDDCAEEATIPMLALATLSAADAALPQQKALLLFCCAVLVLVMAFGVGLLYLGHPRGWARHALLMAGVTGAVWVLCGYGLVFGPALVPGFLGNPFGALDALTAGGAASLHALAFALFQAAVAILTITIVMVVAVGRMRIGPWLLFVGSWLLLVYSPIAYSVFNMADGWIFGSLEVNDQAGGLVVQACAGATALALLLVLWRTARAADPPARVRSTSTVLGGVALLWLGAFGLNVGSEGVIDGLFGTICLNTLLAPAVAAVAWSVVEVLRNGRATIRGAAFGVLAGVVAITPACNILTPLWTVVLGLLAGAVCAAVVSRRAGIGSKKSGTASEDRTGFAVPGIHLVGGALGIAYIGLFATGIGWKDTGQPDGLADQAGAAVGVAAYAFTIAFAIAFVLERTVGVRPPLAAQRSAPRVGLDNPQTRT
jgi:Amt family ammonium transporter